MEGQGGGTGQHGIGVEHIPWSGGKRPVTCTMMGFPARGATPELAGNGARVPDRLGNRLSLGGMVCRVGLGTPPTARSGSHGGR